MYARNNFSESSPKLPLTVEARQKLKTEAEALPEIPPNQIAQISAAPNKDRRAVHISRTKSRGAIPPPDYGGTVIFDAEKEQKNTNETNSTRENILSDLLNETGSEKTSRRKISPQYNDEYDKLLREGVQNNQGNAPILQQENNAKILGSQGPSIVRRQNINNNGFNTYSGKGQAQNDNQKNTVNSKNAEETQNKEAAEKKASLSDMILPHNFKSDDMLLASLVVLLFMGGSENGGKIDDELILIFALLFMVG